LDSFTRASQPAGRDGSHSHSAAFDYAQAEGHRTWHRRRRREYKLSRDAPLDLIENRYPLVRIARLEQALGDEAQALLASVP
jgi:hypothetical protein